MTALIEYNFESYKDLNGKQAIRFGLSDTEGNNYSLDGVPGDIKEQKIFGDTNVIFNNPMFTNFKEDSALGIFSWDSYGVSFKLTVDGDLTLSKINQEYNPRFKINGANVVALGGQGFQELNIVSKEVNFVDDCAVADLQVSAKKMLNKSTLNTETAKISVSNITNPGKIQASKTADIKSINFDNRNGAVHAGETVKLATEHLQNEQGNLSGINSTFVEIGTSLTNDEHSEIGVSGTTTISFKNNMEVEKLGIVRGDQVQLINPPVVKNQGVIAGSQEVQLTNPEAAVIMPNVDIQTPVLKLQTTNFKLSDQTKCDRTILQTTVGRSIELTNEYRTAGVFEFQEPNVTHENIQQIMQQRFGDIASYKVETLPAAKYDISVQATIQADKGITALTPNAKIRVGNNERPNNHPELLAQSGDLTAYVTEFDIEKGGAAAKNGFIWAPKGFPLGRLIEDPNREVFMEFGRASKRHHFAYTSPIVIRNGSFFQIKKTTNIIGLFNNKGMLETQNLQINSTSGSSLLEGVTHVTGDCEFIGHFILQRILTTIDTPRCGKWNLCNSDPAELIIQGKLSGNAVIINEASWLYAQEKTSKIEIVSKDFTSTYNQKFISGTKEENLALFSWYFPRNASDPKYDLKYIHDSGVGLPIQIRTSGNLSNRNNFFVGAQQVFPAQTSFGSAVILPVRNSQLEGFITAPKMLITLGGKLALGSPNPYYINPKNPIRDLISKGFNMHTTYYMPDEIKKLIEQATQPKFYFMFRERFWFDEQASQDFYKDICEHMVVVNRDGSLSKPKSQTILSLSPSYLINRVREDCQEVLMRGFIYEGRPIDADFIKELHRNTTDYLRENKLSGEAFSRALTVAGKSTAIDIEMPSKPILYYRALIDDQGLEVLYPCPYIPIKMINEVRARRGGLVKTNVLYILPEHLTPKELIAFAQDRPALQTSLIKFFNSNPKAKKYLHNKAITVKAQQQQNQLIASDQVAIAASSNSADSAQSSITISSTVQAKKLATIVEGGVVINGKLETEDTLLASLFDDVEIKSILERIGNQENFDDMVNQARVAAKNILQIFAGKQVIFKGAETDSGVLTQIQALAGIIDVPVPLVHQRVRRFYEKHTTGIIKDTYVEQHVSKHKTGSSGIVQMVAGTSAVLQAPEFDTPEVQIISLDGKTRILDTTEVHEHSERTTTEKDTWYGGTSKKSTSTMECSERSKGANFKVKRLLLAGKDGVEVNNIHSTATRNVLYSPDGEVSILLGRNSFASSSITSSSDPFWQKSKSDNIQQATYSESSITGALEIHSQRTILEAVRGKTLSFLQQIDQHQGEIIYSTLDEYYSRQTKTVQGPGAGLVALVALAATIATQGAAGGWAAALLNTAEGVAHTVLTAGFQSLCSQAAASIVSNNGNPVKAIKSLAREGTVKKLATAMISAGVMYKVCDMLKIPKLANRELLQHVEYNIAKASVSATLSVSIDGQDMEHAILGGLVDAAIGTVTASLSAKAEIGEIDAIKKNLMYVILCGTKGALVGHNGALIGALDGLISAVMPDDLFVDNDKKPEQLVRTEKEKVKPKTVEQITEKQKSELKEKIINKLVLLARTKAQGGKGFELPAAIEIVNKKIDKMNITQLRELEKNFVAYFEVAVNFSKPEIKQAVFERPLDTVGLEQTNGGRPGGYKIGLPGIQDPFSGVAQSENSNTNNKSDELPIGQAYLAGIDEPIAPSDGGRALIAAVGTSTYELAASLVKCGVSLTKLLYNSAWHAAEIDMLNNPEYRGALSEVEEKRITQKIAENQEKIHAVLDPIKENPVAAGKEAGKAILYGLNNHYVAEFNEVKEKAASGDVFGATKQALENGIEVGVAVASATKLAGSALTKTGKFLGAISEAVSNTAVNTLAEAASTVASEKSLLTFQYDLAAAKAVKGCARNNSGISNSLNSKTPSLPEVIEDYLGKDFRMLKNKSGDPIFVNNNNTRRIRFDAQNPHGDIPHGHVEHYDQNLGKWLDYTEKHRVYLKDALDYLPKPKPGNG
jgi:filamentous hemagglutinin